MNGIASLLNDPWKSQVEAIWQELEQKCGLIGVRVTPLPHFTYQVVEAYDLPRLVQIVQKIARQTSSFTVHTTGLGVFTGETPVIYLQLVKNDLLLHFHKVIWDRTKEIAHDANPFYSPDLWIPHITLGYGDVTNFNLGCAMETLAFRELNWEITVDNLTFIGEIDQQVNGNCCTFRFGE